MNEDEAARKLAALARAEPKHAPFWPTMIR